MLTHPTVNLLRELKLDGMAEAFAETAAAGQGQGSSTHAELAGQLLIDREAASRSTNRFRSRLKEREVAAQPSVHRGRRTTVPRASSTKALFQQLATCRWIAEHRCLLVTGPCGSASPWLSCALAPERLGRGRLLRALRPPRRGCSPIWSSPMAMAASPSCSARLPGSTWLISTTGGPDRLSANQRRDLMEIVEERYGRGSTLITQSAAGSNSWHEVIGEPTFADAILDRLVHNAYRLALGRTVHAQPADGGVCRAVRKGWPMKKGRGPAAAAVPEARSAKAARKSTHT